MTNNTDRIVVGHFHSVWESAEISRCLDYFLIFSAYQWFSGQSTQGAPAGTSPAMACCFTFTSWNLNSSLPWVHDVTWDSLPEHSIVSLVQCADFSRAENQRSLGGVWWLSFAQTSVFKQWLFTDFELVSKTFSLLKPSLCRCQIPEKK